MADLMGGDTAFRCLKCLNVSDAWEFVDILWREQAAFWREGR